MLVCWVFQLYTGISRLHMGVLINELGFCTIGFVIHSFCEFGCYRFRFFPNRGL